MKTADFSHNYIEVETRSSLLQCGVNTLILINPFVNNVKVESNLQRLHHKLIAYFNRA